jgi:hypothetical protein
VERRGSPGRSRENEEKQGEHTEGSSHRGMLADVGRRPMVVRGHGVWACVTR